ncbi:MAG: murein biosynthesis integral membrane protein MurJ [Planctomycetaceae bacterium]
MRPHFLAGLWTVASSTLLSRILGMIRDAVTSQAFGVSPVTDALWLSFKIPNLTRRLFGEGALTAAFLPAFSKELSRSPGAPPDSAWQLASTVFALLAVVLTGLVLASEGVLWLLSLFLDEESTRLLLGLTAVMLPYAWLICLAAQLTAVLHALGHFTWPALVPVVLNACWIMSVWFVVPRFEPDRHAQAYALAACVVVAGLLQITMQWPVLRRLGFRFRWRFHESWPVVRGVAWGMLPVMFGLSIEQINTLLDGLIAWAFSDPADGSRLPWPGNPAYPLEAGAVSALYLGERMYQFPMGVFGAALGTVLFPLFAQHAAQGAIDRLRDDLTLGLRLVVALGVPASAGLMLIAQPLTHVLLEHGQFTASDGDRTAALIAAYGSGVWAFCSLPILARGFYAVGDRMSPARVGGCALFFDTLLNLTLIWPLGEQGLAYSTAISALVQAAALTWLLQRRLGTFDWPELLRTTGRTLIATAVMAAACLLVKRSLPHSAGLWGSLAALGALLLVGIAVYLAIARLVGLRELRLLFKHQSVDQSAIGESDAEVS